MSSLILYNPNYLYLLLLLVPLVVWYVLRNKHFTPKLTVSSVAQLKNVKSSTRRRLRHIPFIFRCLVVVLIIVALARPQSTENKNNVSTEGIDIVLAMDISSSMLARDFKPDRISAAKDVAIQFIADRPNDRIGLVVFSGESFTQSPLTTDHAALINLTKDVKSGMLTDGTAIGNGLATAVARLKESKSKSKVIILMTDGENNLGEVAPLTAAEIAKTFGIRVYTIGVGTRGKALTPMATDFGVQMGYADVKIDEDMLRKVSQISGGEYFRATDNTKLSEIYNKINELERTKFQVDRYTKRSEEYGLFILLALGILLVEALFRYSILKRIP
jgi:Ca-activated chloride channel family protein